MKKGIYELFLSIWATASYIVPKKKGYYIFIPLHDTNKFSGNIKSLILYANSNYDSERINLVCFNKNIRQEARENNIKVISNFLLAFWATLRAEHIIIDASTLAFSKGNFSLIQLWHGAGFKKLGLLNKNTNDEFKGRLGRHYNKYKLVVSSSESNQKKQNDSFGTTTAKITGLPRNDIFFENKDYFEEIKIKYNIDKYEKIITYVPTFRDFETVAPFSNEFWEQLQNVLNDQNALFVVKKHPWDKYLKIPEGYSRIVDLSNKVSDVQELLLVSDLLISDYSSIMTDFAITSRPILIYMYDYEQYIENCRTLYYDLRKVLPKPYVNDEQDLLEKIKNESWMETEKYKKNYNQFREKFHRYFDGDSSKRVMEEIMKL